MFNRLLSTFRNLRIGLKLGLGFGILVFLTVLVGTVAFVASTIEGNALQRANLAETEVNLIEETDIHFLEARTFELQFLSAYPTEGFDTAYDAYVIPHQQRMDEAFSTLAEARAVLEGQESEVTSAVLEDLDALETTLTAYNSAFLSEVDQVRDGEQATPERFQSGVNDVGRLVNDVVALEQGEAAAALADFERTQNTAFVVELVLLLAAAATGTGLAYAITTQITNQVDELEQVFRAVGVGDFDARAAVLSEDEIGRTADNVNIMIQRLTELLQQANADRQQLQNAVQRLVSDVAGLAAGDLSIRVSDDDEMTGAIGEALNFAIHELNQIVYGVEVAAGQMTNAQHSMNEAINLMVAQAGTSAELADQAANTAGQGDQAVHETITAMERIRDNTQETARRIKRLGEVSQEISTAVRLIEEIADRTTVLALNASIQAAAAGEAGRGFAVVAEEVQRLAERATTATRDIEAMVKGIQTETSEAVYVIEEATREVVDGSQRAQQAGDRMSELNELVDRLATLIQHVSDTTAGQINDSLGNLTNVSGELQASVQALRAAPPAEATPASGD